MVDVRLLVLSLSISVAVVGCARHSSSPPGSVESLGGAASGPRSATLVRGDCPKGYDATIACYRGRDAAGAHVVAAMPSNWNGMLVVHAHGGPALEIRAERGEEDLQRWSIWPRSGYGFVASVYREPGFAVTRAADDTERARRVFVEQFGKPKRTWLHGQSWGAGVAAKTAERYATPHGPYDGVLLTSGVLAGMTRAYDFRLDLRVVYQALCNNHPLPTEASYPLWQGLPASSNLTRPELARRVNECLGLDKAAANRTTEQAAKLRAITQVIRIPASSVLGHLNFATWNFQHLVQHAAGGLNPFGNEGVRYQGSSDDETLNSKVLRYRADPRAVMRLAEDGDLTGRIDVPVLTAHAIEDPTAFVEMSSAFRETMTQAGAASRLAQVYTTDRDHSYWRDATYPALLDNLERWVSQGVVPTPASVAQSCNVKRGDWELGCPIQIGYQPAPLSARSPARVP